MSVNDHLPENQIPASAVGSDSGSTARPRSAEAATRTVPVSAPAAASGAAGVIATNAASVSTPGSRSHAQPESINAGSQQLKDSMIATDSSSDRISLQELLAQNQERQQLIETSASYQHQPHQQLPGGFQDLTITGYSSEDQELPHGNMVSGLHLSAPYAAAEDLILKDTQTTDSNAATPALNRPDNVHADTSARSPIPASNRRDIYPSASAPASGHAAYLSADNITAVSFPETGLSSVTPVPPVTASVAATITPTSAQTTAAPTAAAVADNSSVPTANTVRTASTTIVAPSSVSPIEAAVNNAVHQALAAPLTPAVATSAPAAAYSAVKMPKVSGRIAPVHFARISTAAPNAIIPGSGSQSPAAHTPTNLSVTSRSGHHTFSSLQSNNLRPVKSTAPAPGSEAADSYRRDTSTLSFQPQRPEYAHQTGSQQQPGTLLSQENGSHSLSPQSSEPLAALVDRVNHLLASRCQEVSLITVYQLLLQLKEQGQCSGIGVRWDYGLNFTGHPLLKLELNDHEVTLVLNSLGLGSLDGPLPLELIRLMRHLRAHSLKGHNPVHRVSGYHTDRSIPTQALSQVSATTDPAASPVSTAAPDITDRSQSTTVPASDRYREEYSSQQENMNQGSALVTFLDLLTTRMFELYLKSSQQGSLQGLSLSNPSLTSSLLLSLMGAQSSRSYAHQHRTLLTALPYYLGLQRGSPDALENFLKEVLKVPVTIEPCEFARYPVPRHLRSVLRHHSCILGHNIQLGSHYASFQQRYTLIIGPVTHQELERVLTDSAALINLTSGTTNIPRAPSTTDVTAHSTDSGSTARPDLTRSNIEHSISAVTNAESASLSHEQNSSNNTRINITDTAFPGSCPPPITDTGNNISRTWKPLKSLCALVLQRNLDCRILCLVKTSSLPRPQLGHNCTLGHSSLLKGPYTPDITVLT